VVLVGYGEVGQRIADALDERGIPFVVVEQNRERVEALRAAGMVAVSGDATEPMALVQAHIADAGLLVIAVADTTDLRPMIEAARTLNPSIPIVVRAENAEEARLLAAEGLQHVLHAKETLAQAMVSTTLDTLAPAKGV
jgi:CPA2 family monovalent cation:H+ antiporter-2